MWPDSAWADRARFIHLVHLSESHQTGSRSVFNAPSASCCWCVNNLDLLHHRPYLPVLFACHSWVGFRASHGWPSSRIARRAAKTEQFGTAPRTVTRPRVVEEKEKRKKRLRVESRLLFASQALRLIRVRVVFLVISDFVSSGDVANPLSHCLRQTPLRDLSRMP